MEFSNNIATTSVNIPQKMIEYVLQPAHLKISILLID